MKKAIYAMTMLLFLTAWAGGAHATLTDIGSGVVYDDTNDLYWYQDLNAFDNMTYDEQITYIGTLSHYGGGSWYMATSYEMGLLWDYEAYEIADIFSLGYTECYPTDDGSEYCYDWWTGRYNELYMPGFYYAGAIRKDSQTGEYTMYSLNHGIDFSAYTLSSKNSESSIWGAWVVTNTNPVPEPASMLLLGVGLIGLAGARMRKKFKNTCRQV